MQANQEPARPQRFTIADLGKRLEQRLKEKGLNELRRRLRLLRQWSWDVELVPRERRPFYNQIACAVLFSLLASFLIARILVYLITFGYLPNIFLNVGGVHVHHFTYGIAILILMGFFSLLSFSPQNKIWLALGYGTGLGLTLDEAGQWLLLDDEYWVRQSYDAIIVSSLLLLVVIYLPRYTGVFLKLFEKRKKT